MPEEQNVPKVATAVTKPGSGIESSQNLPIQKEAAEDSLADPLVDSLADPLDVQFDVGGGGPGDGGGGSPNDAPSPDGPGAPGTPDGSSPPPQGPSLPLYAKLAGPSVPASGAGEKVRRARSSQGQPLPEAVQAKFERSLGKDLSDVRVHTGSASVQAAGGINANAYAEGKDIHFAGGKYDPQSSAGEKLLAHEVAHTVQQSTGGGAASGSAGGVQASPKVSRPGDAAEVQADRAADAMVQGKETEVTAASGEEVQRTVSAAQMGESWASGEEVLQAEAAVLAAQLSGIVGLSQSLLGMAGADPTEVKDKLVEAAEERIEGDLEVRQQEIDHFEEQIEHISDIPASDRTPNQKEMLKYYRDRLPVLEAEHEQLDDYLDDGDGIEKQAVDTANKLVGYGAAIANIGKLLTSGSQSTTAAVFNDLSDGLGKVGKVFALGSATLGYLDQSALNEFQRNPNQQTVRTWAKKVGTVFESCAPFADGLPPGFATITSEMLKLPSKTINSFIAVMDQHEAKMTKVMKMGRSKCGAEMLDEGTESCGEY
jgi:hypothetical protein